MHSKCNDFIYIFYLVYSQIQFFYIKSKQKEACVITGKNIYSFKEIILCIIMLIVAGIVTYKSHRVTIFMFALIMVCAKGMDMSKAIKYMGNCG